MIKVLKRIPLINAILSKIKAIHYSNLNRKLEKKADNRLKNGDCKFDELLKLKGKFQGKRCFIVATGPSLRISDLEIISNEYTFGVNSICKLFENTKWRPTFYGIQDSLVFDKLKRTIEDSKDEYEYIFLGSNLIFNKNIFENLVQFPFNHYYHLSDMEKGIYYVEFSNDCYRMVYDGYTITYSMIQLAVYMGFSTICLLGVDCDYSGKKKHVIESGFVDPNAHLNYKKMIVAYEKALEYCLANNIKIYNCTRGGKLEVFERKTIEEVLENDIEKV